MSTFTPYQQELKIKERVDAILASRSTEDVYKCLKPYRPEQCLTLLQGAIKQCTLIIDYYASQGNDMKLVHYLSLEYILESMEEQYRHLLWR